VFEHCTKCKCARFERCQALPSSVRRTGCCVDGAQAKIRKYAWTVFEQCTLQCKCARCTGTLQMLCGWCAGLDWEICMDCVWAVHEMWICSLHMRAADAVWMARRLRLRNMHGLFEQCTKCECARFEKCRALPPSVRHTGCCVDGVQAYI